MSKIDRRRKTVLILECDSDKLRQQNLDVGAELRDQINLVFPRNLVELVSASTEGDLLESFAELSRTKQSYRTIIIIGHSNRHVLALSADRPVGWRSVGNWISTFRPHRVILLACEAGRWLPCAAVFDSIPSLDVIFGSPLPASKQQQLVVLARVLHILGARKEDVGLNRLLQWANFALTGGVMFTRTRKEYENGGNEEGEIWTNALEPFIEEIASRFRT